MNPMIELAEECFNMLVDAGLKKGEINAVCDIIKAYARTSNAFKGTSNVKQKTFITQLKEGYL
ncbi:MAG: hypothetical protein LUQ09_05060 [Methanomassiliicoccales archaeon]|nr:hypothetical protein [Methanomassiliicoccales archaeon]